MYREWAFERRANTLNLPAHCRAGLSDLPNAAAHEDARRDAFIVNEREREGDRDIAVVVISRNPIRLLSEYAYIRACLAARDLPRLLVPILLFLLASLVRRSINPGNAEALSTDEQRD